MFEIHYRHVPAVAGTCRYPELASQHVGKNVSGCLMRQLGDGSKVSAAAAGSRIRLLASYMSAGYLPVNQI